MFDIKEKFRKLSDGLVVSHSLSKTLICGIYLQGIMLENYVRNMEGDLDCGMVRIVPTLPLVVINMPCGKARIYRSFAQMPGKSVRCSCGDKNHWFIKYGKLGVK